MSGVFNKFVEINLHSGENHEFFVNPEYLKDFIGGSSLAARLFFDMASPDLDPLSSDNPLFVMSGPMVGTSFPGSSRFVMCAKSPQTGIWGEASSGGSFGAELKKAGLDGMVFTGKAGSPVYILIEDDEIKIIEADDLWGKDTFETIDVLKEKHEGDRKVRILSIGPAGENLVKYAAVCNDKAHYLGRVGMGAVMGSKNIKAIVVRGTGKVPISDENAYKTARKNTLNTAKESMITMSFNQVGTAAAMEMGMMTGDVPIKNWSVGMNDEMSEKIGGGAIAEKILTKRKACGSCPIACKPEVEVTEPPYQVSKGPGPEYETCGSFGSMQENLNLNGVAKANDLCNRLGLDTISCGATIAFIMEAYEKDLLNSTDLDGMEFNWGNIDSAIQLIKKIAYREGFGDRAAEGSFSLAQSLPEEAMDFMVAIKGLELPMHDPRGFHGMGLAYMMSTRGACHLQHSCQAVEQGMVAWVETGLKEDYTGPNSEGKAEMVYITENIGQMANNICVCHFVHWAIGMQNLLDGFNTITGYNLPLEDFMEIGKRSWMLKRVLGNMMGATSKDDKLPARILMPLAEGGSDGTVPDEELMKSEYYGIRGLDANGYPLPEALDSLNLGFLKEKIELLSKN